MNVDTWQLTATYSVLLYCVLCSAELASYFLLLGVPVVAHPFLIFLTLYHPSHPFKHQTTTMRSSKLNLRLTQKLHHNFTFSVMARLGLTGTSTFWACVGIVFSSACISKYNSSPDWFNIVQSMICSLASDCAYLAEDNFRCLVQTSNCHSDKEIH